MSARVIRKAVDVTMVGLDHHNGLYYINIFNGLAPGPPVPPLAIPPGFFPVAISLHPVYAFSAWPALEDKSVGDVLAEGDPVCQKSHAATQFLHIPPGGNLLVPVTIGFSSSKWMLGVGSVLAGGAPVASSMAGPIGANYNCQDPCSLPLPNVMVATNSVHVTPSAADWAAAAIEMAIQSAVEAVLAVVLPLGFDAAGKVITKMTAGIASSVIAKYAVKKVFVSAAANKAANELAEQAAKEAMAMAAEQMAREAAEKVAKDATKSAAEKEVAKQLAREAAEKLAKEQAESAAKRTALETVKEAPLGLRDRIGKAATEKLLKKGFKQQVQETFAGLGKEALPKGVSDWGEGLAGDFIKNKTTDAVDAEKRTGELLEEDT